MDNLEEEMKKGVFYNSSPAFGTTLYSNGYKVFCLPKKKPPEEAVGTILETDMIHGVFVRKTGGIFPLVQFR